MHSVVKDGYLCWHSARDLFFFLLFFSLEHSLITGLASQNLSQDSSRLLSNHDYSRNQISKIGNLSCLSYLENSGSCQDLKGFGSFNTTCLINSSLSVNKDLCVYGTGNIEIFPHALIVCPFKGCSLSFKVSGSIKIGAHASIVAGSIVFEGKNLTLEYNANINTTSLGGPPPGQTSGTPIGYDGAGGGHGGRGASCLKSNKTNWGGDVYAWSTLSEPWSYGSKGGSTSAEKQCGGDGGGRVMIKVSDWLQVDGSVTAEGGNGGLKGGGGSGGSIIISALKLKGNGMISAAGGSGFGGGGGGRISLDCYSIQDVKITARGGQSFGCHENAGAAGTIYDRALESLRISNDNLTTHTETPLLDFPMTVLWSNVFVERSAKALVPLLWTRVQVRGQIRLLDGGSICFGLSEYPVSEFELVAEELLISDSIIKVYGAFRMYVKMLLMWNSRIQIDGGGNNDVGTSVLEARNLIVLTQNSIIASNADLGVYGQGLLKLTGHGDVIKAQRLFLALFYNIEVGAGSLLQAPLDDGIGSNLGIQSHCESPTCPKELIIPPDDCHANNSLSLTLQICRVEDVTISGFVRGSIIHIHRARTVTVDMGGVVSASGLGCKEGIGKGKFSKYGAGGGAGHGGMGGAGVYNGMQTEGGQRYGNADFPCELGSGNPGSIDSSDSVSGGGMIVMGSIKWPLASLKIYGSLRADGQSQPTGNFNGTMMGGLGGASGGTILLFLQSLVLERNSSLSVAGGDGGLIGGGGGGGGRIHFEWSNIATGDEYIQIASVNGTLASSGGAGSNGGHHGEEGTITGKKCPRGLYGTFCMECPVGTYKDVAGSNSSLCTPCSLDVLPNRAEFIYVKGGVTQPFCPYKCLSEKFKMPRCYTPLEELVYTFGGPWIFTLVVSFILVLLALILNAVRIKLIGSDVQYRCVSSIQHDSSGSFPYLLSLAEVPGTSRAEETQSHVHRMYFMGPNTFREPWHLPHSPPYAIVGIVYEDAFNRFIDEINSVAAYEWWEGSIHSILAILAYPCAWFWKQWRRRKKIHRLQEYVKSEYDHSCLRSCRSRALYKGMKVGSTPDLMVAYIDFFLGGDEKRLDIASTIQKFPMCIIFGGDGSYMSPYCLHSDTLLTNLLSQYVPTAIWNRLVSGLDAQLRTVRQGCIRSTLLHVIAWINSHGNPQLKHHGVRVELGWFQATASGYYQLGIVATLNEQFFSNAQHSNILDICNSSRKNTGTRAKSIKHFQQSEPSVSDTVPRRRLTGGVNGGILNEATLKSLVYKRDYLFPLSLLLQNTKPIGLQETLQLLICIILLGDFTITILTLVQFFWISLGAFLAILLILPLSLVSTFPAGLNALFSRGPKRSSLARIYALWNATSLINVIVAFACGMLYSVFSTPEFGARLSTSDLREDNGWWILPSVLLLVKSIQAGLVNWHIGNLELPDPSLFSPDLESFWAI